MTSDRQSERTRSVACTTTRAARLWRLANQIQTVAHWLNSATIVWLLVTAWRPLLPIVALTILGVLVRGIGRLLRRLQSGRRDVNRPVQSAADIGT